MRRLLLFLGALILLPAGAAARTPCPRQPLPEPLTSAGYTADPAAGAETLLFSASPSFERESYAVRIHRSASNRGASVRVLKLRRQWACNRHSVVKYWRFALGRERADAFFASAARLEREWRGGEVVLDGTPVRYVHRWAGGSWSKSANASVGGGATLSRLILSLLHDSGLKGEVPDSDDWTSGARTGGDVR